MSDPSTQKQLDEWVAGRPTHNDARDECCPDFSCCVPELLADEVTRRTFAAADEGLRHQMLGQFLGAAFAYHGKRDSTYIAGHEPLGADS